MKTKIDFPKISQGNLLREEIAQGRPVLLYLGDASLDEITVSLITNIEDDICMIETSTGTRVENCDEVIQKINDTAKVRERIKYLMAFDCWLELSGPFDNENPKDSERYEIINESLAHWHGTSIILFSRSP